MESNVEKYNSNTLSKYDLKSENPDAGSIYITCFKTYRLIDSEYGDRKHSAE